MVISRQSSISASATELIADDATRASALPPSELEKQKAEAVTALRKAAKEGEFDDWGRCKNVSKFFTTYLPHCTIMIIFYADMYDFIVFLAVR